MLCHMDADERAALGKRVEAARTSAGITKEAAARRADISTITWKRVEDGLRVQDVKLAAVLRVIEPAPEPVVLSPVTVSAASDIELLAEVGRRLGLTIREQHHGNTPATNAAERASADLVVSVPSAHALTEPPQESTPTPSVESPRQARP